MSESKVVGELPSCIAIRSKSDGKFLRYVHEDRAENYGRLQLNGEDALNSFARFDVEPSRLHKGLVHIRCRYNRKYWVARRQQGDDDDRLWIVAGADEAEEDLAKLSCTLIKAVPVPNDDGGDRSGAATAAGGAVSNDGDHPSEESPTMTFRFVLAAGTRLQAAGTADDDGGAGARMQMSGTAGSVGSCMCVVVGSGDDEQQVAGAGGDGSFFTVVNLSNSERLLPKLLAFKGSNGKYMRWRTIAGRDRDYENVVFESDDIGDAAVLHETQPNVAGDLVYVLNRGTGKFWRVRDNWVLADGVHHLALFVPHWFRITPLGGGDFAVQHSTTGSFCFNQTAPRAGESYFVNCLEASARTLRREALVRVEEAALHREIYDVVYHLNEARVYDSRPLTMATTGAVNDTTTANTKRLAISFEETETATWDSTIELTLGYTATMKIGFPKLGLGAQAQLSAEFFGAYNWGETVVTTVSKQVEYEVTVPPRTKVSVRVIATTASYDVPFSYMQRTVYYDGRIEREPKTGGIFTGVNSYNFQFETTEMPLERRITMAS